MVDNWKDQHDRAMKQLLFTNLKAEELEERAEDLEDEIEILRSYLDRIFVATSSEQEDVLYEIEALYRSWEHDYDNWEEIQHDD